MRWLAFAVLLGGCVSTENPFLCADTCDGGAGGGSAGGGAGGGTSGVGGGGGSGVGGGSAGAGGGGSVQSDGGCTEDWQCSPWDLTDAGTAARVCTDLASCGTTTGRPATGPTALPALDLNLYKCQVQPIVERGCGMLGCHGTETDRTYRLYSRGRLRNSELVPQVSSCLGGGMLNLAAEGTGTVMCLGWSRLTATEWKKNFDRARLFGVGLPTVDDSELLTQPLEGNYRAHAGVKMFVAGDPSYLAIKSWLSGATSGPCDAGFN